MNRKINLHLFVLLTAALLLGGCNFVRRSSSATANRAAAPTPMPSASAETSEKIKNEDKIRAFQKQAENLAKLGTTTKLNAKARITGKIAIVTSESFGGTPYHSLEGYELSSPEYDKDDLENYGLTQADLATDADEIDSLFQISCDKGRKLGVYKTTGNRTIDGFALNCKVSLVDYESKTVVAQKTFASRDLPDQIEVSAGTTERTAYVPTEEIGKYFQSLRSK